MRLAVDIGSTSTVVVEEDSAAAGSVGGKLLGPRAPRSGFRLLAGDAETAAVFFEHASRLEPENGVFPN